MNFKGIKKLNLRHVILIFISLGVFIYWFVLPFWYVMKKDYQLNNETKNHYHIKDNTIMYDNTPLYKFIPIDGGDFHLKIKSEFNYQNQNNEFLNTPQKLSQIKIADYKINSFLIGETMVNEFFWYLVMNDFNDSITQEQEETYILLLQKKAEHSYKEWKEFKNKLVKNINLNISFPTFEQWKYVENGGQKSKGFVYSGSNSILDVIHYFQNDDDYRLFLKERIPNELGIYDMSGSDEFVSTTIEDYYKKFEPKFYCTIKLTDIAKSPAVCGGFPLEDTLSCRVDAPLNRAKKESGIRLVLNK